MPFPPPKWFLRPLSVAFALILLAACSRSASVLDAREDRDPLMRRARAKEKARDIDGAIELYNEALMRKPELARAHLMLGLLYEKEKEDYLRAIYHYQRYLELRPQAEKKELIEEVIRRAKLTYAASLPDRPSAAVEEIAMLKREIARLKAELAAKEGAARARASVASPAVTPPRSNREEALVKPEPAPPEPPVQTYQVKRGDNLSRIAGKMYNDSTKWKVIYEANRNTLDSPESLREGQTLIIPNL